MIMTFPRKTYFVALVLASTFALVSRNVSAQARSSAQQPPSKAQADEKTRPQKEPDYSQEAFVIEQMKTLYRFERDGTGRREASLRVKVQSEAGLEAFGELYFPYLSANEKLDVDFVRVHKPDGSVVAAPADGVRDMTAPVAREAPVYTDLRLKQVTVPGLRPGDVLEYHLVWHVHTPLAPNQFWLEYDFLKNDYIVLDEQLEVNIPADSVVKLKAEQGLESSTKEQDGRRVYTWKHANPKREDEGEKSKAKRSTDEPKPPQIQVSTFQTWAEVGRWYADLERDRVVPDASVRAKVAELVRGRASDLEKVEAIYGYVSKNFRYVSLSFGQGRYQPHAASEVMANEYGDCKDKHTLLAAMLNAAGIHSYAALIPSSRKLDPDVPSPAQFDHVISVIPLGGEAVWVDTTAEVAPFRLLAPSLRDKQALVVADDAPARLEKTPADPPFPASESVEVEGQVNELGALSGRAHITVRGDRELLFRLLFRRTPPNDWKRMGRMLAALSGLSAEVNEVRPSDPAETDKPFQVEYDFTSADFLDWSGKRASVSLPLPPLSLPSVDADREDSQPVKLGPATEISYRVKLTLPAKYKARAPLSVSVTRDYAEYRSSYKLEENTLVAERTLRLLQRELPPSRAQDYQAFAAAARADAEQTLSLETETAGTSTIPDSMKVEDLVEAADAAEKNENYALAEALLKRVLEKEPKHKTARRELALALYSQRKYDEAIKVLRQQVEANPFDDYSYDLLGQALWQQQDYTGAEAAFRKQLEVTPLHKSAQANLGRLLVEWRKYKEAVPELERAITLDPDDESLYVEMGSARMNLGQTEKATEAFDKAVELAPGPAVWNDVAYALAQGNVQLDKAQQYAESAVTAITTELRNSELEHVTPDDLDDVSSLVAYWDTLGWVQFQKGDIDLAERYVTAGWLLGQYGEGGYHLGRILEKRGRTEEAARTYAMAALAYMPVPEARESLTRLVGKEKAESLLAAAREELAAMSTVRLGPLLKDEKGKAEADFYVALVPGPSREAKVAGVKFIGGSEKLRPLSAALKSASYRVRFPEETPSKLILRGTLTCTRGDCTFVTARPMNANSPD
jgi:tetratricopeptide (TPR) repeat protein/transglutaminase-like putative cysteine protease